MSKETDSGVGFSQYLSAVVLQELSRDPEMKVISDLYDQGKLLIFASPSKHFEIGDKTASAIVGFAPVDPNRIKKEAYLFLNLNISKLPKTEEDDERMNKFREMLKRAAILVSAGKDRAVAYKDIGNESSYTATLEKVLKSKPVLAVIST